MAEGQGSKHFVLVHSAGHGEWYWFKVKPLLESAGHKVTTLQLAPSITSWAGVDSINTVHTLSQYSQPLLNLLENLEEKVVLVGHSAGGLSLALAMEKFPDKILVAVFIAAFMPDTSHKPSHVIDEYMKVPMEWKDSYSMSNKGNTTWLFFSDEFLRTRLYQLCSAEVVVLLSEKSLRNDEDSMADMTLGCMPMLSKSFDAHHMTTPAAEDHRPFHFYP